LPDAQLMGDSRNWRPLDTRNGLNLARGDTYPRVHAGWPRNRHYDFGNAGTEHNQRGQPGKRSDRRPWHVLL
jgi:hypothetical protein